MGLIAIEGMQFYAHHGFYKEEQVIGGQYEVDIYLETDFKAAAEHDKLEETINYEVIYLEVKEVMREKSRLIEHVADRIITKIQERVRDIAWMKVRVAKMNPPLKGNVRRVYVEMEKNFQIK